MRTREHKIEKNHIEKLTEEIKNLRLELKTSNGSIIALLETVKKLSGNSTCKTFNPSKGRKTEANATLRETEYELRTRSNKRLK